MENEEAYINMRKSLDSMRDVALADYALIESAEDKKIFADFVTESVRAFISANAENHRDLWHNAEGGRAKAFTEHAEDLLLDEAFSKAVTPNCPPGFKEVDGLCVPI